MNAVVSVRIVDGAVLQRERRMGRIVDLAAKLLDIQEMRAFGQHGRASAERKVVYSELATELALLRSGRSMDVSIRALTICQPHAFFIVARPDELPVMPIGETDERRLTPKRVENR
jgi:hypothetical protein